MTCTNCSKDILKVLKKNWGISSKSSIEDCVKIWAKSCSKSLSGLNIYKPINIHENFIQEVELLSTSFNLLQYLKQAAKNNDDVINLLCVMAYYGLLNISEDTEVLELKQKDGTLVAHWAAKGGHLTAPYDSGLWCIQDDYGKTPAHWAASRGLLDAPYESGLWRLVDDTGMTPAHYSAFMGFLGAPYDSDLWRLQDNFGQTPAHFSAHNGFLNVSYDSDLWYICDNYGKTAAHLAADSGVLQAPYEFGLWRIQDINGETPAHFAARKGHLTILNDSDLWSIKDNTGNTPAHWAASLGNLRVPYDSTLWYIQNNRGETPLHWAAQRDQLNASYSASFWSIRSNENLVPARLSKEMFTIFLHQPEMVIKQCLKFTNLKIKECHNAWDILGYIRILALVTSRASLPQISDIQDIIDRVSPKKPNQCDFLTAIWNITRQSVLKRVLKESQLRSLYCYALTGALAYLFKENKQSIKNILHHKEHAYINDSAYSMLSEYGLWEEIKQVASQRYGICLDDLN